MSKSTDEYPYKTEEAFEKERRRHPTVPLHEVEHILEAEGMTLLDYLKIHHADMSAEEMAMVYLHLHGGMTYAEIAAGLGVTPQAVHRRLHRLLRKITDAG